MLIPGSGSLCETTIVEEFCGTTDSGVGVPSANVMISTGGVAFASVVAPAVTNVTQSAAPMRRTTETRAVVLPFVAGLLVSFAGFVALLWAAVNILREN